jgi:hypothetical protein
MRSDLVYTSLKNFLDTHSIDDEARWWLEIESTLEFNPIREYKNVVLEDRYEHTVSLDLDTRVKVLIELFKEAKYNKRINKTYLGKMTLALRAKCKDRPDLIDTINQLL